MAGRLIFVKGISGWIRHPHARLASLVGLVLVLPVCLRLALGWSDPHGYLSDLAIGSLLVLLLHRRRGWLAFAVLLFWAGLTIATAELVSAVGRLPAVSDVHYLLDPSFVENSTGGGFAHAWLAGVLAAGLGLWCVVRWLNRKRPARPLPRLAWAAPLLLLGAHWGAEHLAPSDADQWRQFNLPHQLLAAAAGEVQREVEHVWLGDAPQQTPPMEGLTRSDLDGKKLLDAPGRARNLLIITLEGIPGAYVRANREAMHSNFNEDLMPNLSRWAERGMNTPDYVLHSHQTIRGLYAMLCGDYDKFDNGTPKGVELLTQQQRNQDCLPAQLRQHGFATHFLQGAGLRFMAKDKIMPHIGFESTHGLEWFNNPNHLDFAWGKDDKAFFEGALEYVRQIDKKDQPWMLTLLTVGTHQPYSAPQEYLDRYETSKQAAVAYLDDAVGTFLDELERRGIMKDTLVVITSDESHGIEGVRLASSWGFNLMLAPEQQQLPRLKSGVYGHVDLTASLLDYFALPIPEHLSGRSLLRDYARGREMMSFTNGKLRYHDGQGTFTECDFQERCRRYASAGFIAAQASYLGRDSTAGARSMTARAEALDRSLIGSPLNQRYQFGSADVLPLHQNVRDDWTDNLIGAQYLEMPKGSYTRVRLKVRTLDPEHNAYIQLKAKEFEQDVQVGLPSEMVVTADRPLEFEFRFDNPQVRKAFSFHLLGYGAGSVEISDFSVITRLAGDEDLQDELSEDSVAHSS